MKPNNLFFSLAIASLLMIGCETTPPPRQFTTTYESPAPYHPYYTAAGAPSNMNWMTSGNINMVSNGYIWDDSEYAHWMVLRFENLDSLAMLHDEWYLGQYTETFYGGAVIGIRPVMSYEALNLGPDSFIHFEYSGEMTMSPPW